jgi:hypothetical protein
LVRHELGHVLTRHFTTHLTPFPDCRQLFSGGETGSDGALSKKRCFSNGFETMVPPVYASRHTLQCCHTPAVLRRTILKGCPCLFLAGTRYDCLKGENKKIYIAMQGASEFTLAGELEHWSITDRLSVVDVCCAFKAASFVYLHCHSLPYTPPTHPADFPFALRSRTKHRVSLPHAPCVSIKVITEE